MPTSDFAAIPPQPTPVEADDAVYAAKLAALRAAVKVGDDDIKAGRYQTFESAADIKRFVDELTESVLAERKIKKAS
jgi:antitoxin ParD1/3/4